MKEAFFQGKIEGKWYLKCNRAAIYVPEVSFVVWRGSFVCEILWKVFADWW